MKEYAFRYIRCFSRCRLSGKEATALMKKYEADYRIVVMLSREAAVRIDEKQETLRERVAVLLPKGAPAVFSEEGKSQLLFFFLAFELTDGFCGMDEAELQTIRDNIGGIMFDRIECTPSMQKHLEQACHPGQLLMESLVIRCELSLFFAEFFTRTMYYMLRGIAPADYGADAFKLYLETEEELTLIIRLDFLDGKGGAFGVFSADSYLLTRAGERLPVGDKGHIMILPPQFRGFLVLPLRGRMVMEGGVVVEGSTLTYEEMRDMVWYPLVKEGPCRFAFGSVSLARADSGETIRRLSSPWCGSETEEERIDEREYGRIFNSRSAGEEVETLFSNGLIHVRREQPVRGMLCSVIGIKKDFITQHSEDIKEAIRYIRDHLSENISMKELARVAILSESRFKVKFRNQIGLPPMEYIREKKLEAAERLLRDGARVSEAAAFTGFASDSYFSKVFKKSRGMCPRKYADYYLKNKHS